MGSPRGVTDNKKKLHCGGPHATSGIYFFVHFGKMLVGEEM